MNIHQYQAIRGDVFGNFYVHITRSVTCLAARQGLGRPRVGGAGGIGRRTSRAPRMNRSPWCPISYGSPSTSS